MLRFEEVVSDRYKKKEKGVNLERKEKSRVSSYKNPGLYRVQRNIIVKCIKLCRGSRK